MLLFGIWSLSRNHLYNHEINNYVFLATFFHVSRDKVEYTNLEPLIGVHWFLLLTIILAFFEDFAI